ncbi:MAG TPA: RNA ligase RtcB family protein [Verrucomicrobiae bacterium]|nr:RNA ligase RtcB family protein [Verrucomicrobiae bacterium]
MSTIVDSMPATVQLIASSASWIEGEAIRQLHATARLDGVRLAVGLPDLHPGKGHPVGAAFATEGILYPAIIGGDIGCGMGLWRTDLPRRKAKLDRWVSLPFDLEQPWEGDVASRLARNGLASTPYDSAFGTVGGGNHFAELQAVEEVMDAGAFAGLELAQDCLVALIHSGSRGTGESLLREVASRHGASGLEVDSPDAQSYLERHDEAVRWARASRALIAERFLAMLGATHAPVLDIGHNQITPRDTEAGRLWVHRKGAAAADDGPVVIPGSRGTLSYLVQPLGDGSGSAWSVAHGAGRKWTRSESRGRVRERFRPPHLTQTELGGRVICEDRDLLYEEAPMAYKKIETVIQDLVDAGLISVIATLRPLLTYKTRKARC